MSNDRDELFGIIYGITDNPNWAVSEVHTAILAAGYRKPRTIATLEELKAMEDPAMILMDYCGHPYQWGEGMGGDEGWMAPHDPTPITSHHLWRFIPLTVLHEG